LHYHWIVVSFFVFSDWLLVSDVLPGKEGERDIVHSATAGILPPGKEGERDIAHSAAERKDRIFWDTSRNKFLEFCVRIWWWWANAEYLLLLIHGRLSPRSRDVREQVLSHSPLCQHIKLRGCASYNDAGNDRLHDKIQI
jgi:hypothetical protein